MVPQELVVFRKALHQLEVLEPSHDRRFQRRYNPTGPMARAKVQFADGQPSEDADVVDLSFNGIRLAVSSCCRCQEGDRCCIDISPDGATMLHLEAEVRWVKAHPFITVFGVLLAPDQNGVQPV